MLSHLRAHIHKRDELVCNAGSKQASSGNQEISEYPSAPGILSCCLINNQPVYPALLLLILKPVLCFYRRFSQLLCWLLLMDINLEFVLEG